MSKNTVETEGPQMTSQHDAYALSAGLERLYARMRIHTPTHPGTHIHARTHARKQAQAYSHRPICNKYCFSTAKIVP
jgi:kynurenine formamidase